MRISRVIRNRIAKKTSPRQAETIEVDRKGLVIDGERFPYWIGEDVEVDHYGEAAIVHLSVFTKRFALTQQPRHGRLTHNFN